jgi:pilus assembly protein CpaE
VNVLLVSEQAGATAPLWNPDMGFDLHIVQSTPDAVVRVAQRQAPDVLVLDINGPGLIDVIQGVRSGLPDITIIPVVHDPTAELLLDMLRIGVADVLTHVRELTVERIAAVRGRRAGVLDIDERKPCQLLAFISAKGGAGATTVAANSAYALAQTAQRPVLVIDLSLPWGDMDLYLPSTSEANDLSSFLDQIERIDRALFKVMVSRLDDNIDFIPAPLDPAKASALQGDALVKLIATAKQIYHWILLDFGSSMNFLNLSVLDMLDSLNIVVRSDVPGARRTGQLLKLLKDVDFPQEKIAVVLNAAAARSSLSAESFETAIGRASAVRLPYAGADNAERGARNQPIVASAPKSPFAKAITDWVQQKEDNHRKDDKKWSLFANIFLR